MTIPPSIPFSSIIFGDRARSDYTGIPELADSILENGLETPIKLKALPDGQFMLLYGGRRYRALEHLGVTELYFATSGEPGRPGFILHTGEDSAFQDKMSELIENLHREKLDWRDELKLLVPAYRAANVESLREGKGRLMSYTFGAMVGYNYTDMRAALLIYDAFIENPARFDGCVSITNAYQRLLDETAREGERMLVEATKPTKVDPLVITVEDSETGIVTQVCPPIQTIPLSSQFMLGNSLDWMERERPVFNHIICDPDFAVSKERLEAGTANAGVGVAQDNINESLADLRRFINLARTCVKSYLIFFYDLDHHEKLQAWCTAAGFAVQRWPITWVKTDYRGNNAPQHNFTKNEEWAMVCRIPSATLAMPAPLSAFSLSSGNTANELGHPFAKSPEVWMKLFSAVARPGDTTFDPFAGVGSSLLPALRFGLRPRGMELQEQHYNRGMLNLQEYYKKQNPNCVFE